MKYLMIILMLIVLTGCATYEVQDGKGNIIESGSTFGFLRTMEVSTKYENGLIKERSIKTKSSTKDIMLGANELIDSSVNTIGKLKP